MNLLDILNKAGYHASPTGKPDEYVTECPQCGKQKLYVNPDKKSWICFRCGEGGGARKLCKRFGVEYTDTPQTDLARLREQMRQRTMTQEIHKSPLPPEMRSVLAGDHIANIVKQYLERRGVTEDMMRRWDLRVSGQDLIFPIFDTNDQFITYQARRIIGDGPKSMNPEGDNDAIFNLHLARFTPGVVVVEGPFDAMAVHTKLEDHGIGAVALLGHNCSAVQASIIGRILKPSIVWVLLDPDISEPEMHKVGHTIRSNGAADVRVATLPVDPDEAAAIDLLGALEIAPSSR